MKRFFLISIMLLLIGAVYADGPRYRFKSRRALQSLWRREMLENPRDSRFNSRDRKLRPRELQGEGGDKMKHGSGAYGVIVDNPFENGDLQYGDGSRSESGSKSPLFGSPLHGIDIPPYPGTTDDGPHIVIGKKDPDEPYNPFVGGTTTGGKGKEDPYAPPVMPIGDGIPVLLIFMATLIAIKKRLSK